MRTLFLLTVLPAVIVGLAAGAITAARTTAPFWAGVAAGVAWVLGMRLCAYGVLRAVRTGSRGFATAAGAVGGAIALGVGAWVVVGFWLAPVVLGALGGGAATWLAAAEASAFQKHEAAYRSR